MHTFIILIYISLLSFPAVKMCIRDRDTPGEKGEPIFHAWIWPGPYIFDLTDDSKKTDNTFPFTDDGKKQCVDWINEVISAHSNEYPKNKTDVENPLS